MQLHDYDRFRVDDGAQVLALLRRSAAVRALCSVRAAGRPETYLSPLRELGDEGQPLLEAPRAPVIGRALVPGSVAAIELRLPECRVSFESRVKGIAPIGGKPVLRLERPVAVTRLHKRETVRVRLPGGAGVLLTLDESDRALSALPMNDLCVQGGSLSLTGVCERFEAGKVFERGRLRLPDGEEWPVTLRVVHAGVVRRQADRGEMRIGVQFVQPVEGFETAVGQLVGAIARGATQAQRA